MDPLSDVLALLKPRGSMSVALDAAGDWSIEFPRWDVIRFNAVIAGHCWVAVEGVADAVHLGPGECFLLPSGRPFRVASDLDAPPVDMEALFASKRDGVATIHGGGEFFAVAGLFALEGDHADVLLGVLPPIVHLRAEPDRAALRWILERLLQEQRERRPGAALVAQHLAQVMLVQALRQYLEEGPRGGVGWLYALADPPMCAAITAIHDAPARRWTLPELADRAGLSRSTFALRFKATVGTSPIGYLTRWRMLLAADRLANSGEPIAAIALSLGYESESAFSTAFKRVMGCAPRRYARGRVPTGPDRRMSQAMGT